MKVEIHIKITSVTVIVDVRKSAPKHSMTEIAKCQQFSFQANNVKLIVISAVNIHGLSYISISPEQFKK